MVISFSFSFPALFFTCVFLVSTHTTLSFTSDLDTHTHTHVNKSAWNHFSRPLTLRADSLLDAQVCQCRVQEGEWLVRRVGLHLDGQRPRHGDLPLQLHTHHLAMRPGGLPVCRAVLPSAGLLRIGLARLQQAFCLVCCQLDFLISIWRKNVTYPSPSLALSQWLILDPCVHLLSPVSRLDPRQVLLQIPAGPLSSSRGLMIQSSASSDEKGLWKVWVFVSDACGLVLWLI